IPDIVLIKNEKAELIIDTKYKVLDSSKRYYGVSSGGCLPDVRLLTQVRVQQRRAAVPMERETQ
ncbi:hypothetical protein, partial [Candidatus Pyrohabitans sp.]